MTDIMIIAKRHRMSDPVEQLGRVRADPRAGLKNDAYPEASHSCTREAVN